MIIVPTSEHVRNLISTFTFEKKESPSQPNHFRNFRFVTTNSLIFIARDYTDRTFTTHKVFRISEVVKIQLVGEIDDESSKEGLETCKHFLVDSKMENGRQRVFHFAMDLLYAHFSGQKKFSVFRKLKRAAKLNVAFGFFLKNIKDGTFRFYYAHENINLMGRSKSMETEKALVKV